LIKDRLHPGHKNSWNLLGALNRRVTHAIVTADELIMALRLDGWQVLSTRKFSSRQPLSESLRENTVLMNFQHSSQQKFFDSSTF
jgi:hypothetical protein